MPPTRIMYVELKTGHNDDGPASITRVQISKSGRSITYRGRELLHVVDEPGGGTFMDAGNQNFYRVSAPKKNQQYRQKGARGPVDIDDDVRADYLKLIGSL